MLSFINDYLRNTYDNDKSSLINLRESPKNEKSHFQVISNSLIRENKSIFVILGYRY